MSRALYVMTDKIPAVRLNALEAVKKAPDGWVVEIKQKTRTLEQNALLWSLLTDLSEQVEWYGHRLSPEEFKDLLTAGLRKSKVIPNMDGSGFVILGQRTSTMTKAEFSDLIELIYCFGAERGVKWRNHGRTDPR
jgi:hypothetical protein